MVVFETWRDYVVNKKIRERRDAEKQYEREIKQFATAMQSVKIAQHHVSMWKRCVDVYTDQVIQLTSRDLTHLPLHLHETSTGPPDNSPSFNMHSIFPLFTTFKPLHSHPPLPFLFTSFFLHSLLISPFTPYSLLHFLGFLAA